ncbi:MAG: hypothetical protein ACQESH_07170 [Campylobacterota bacterium]
MSKLHEIVVDVSALEAPQPLVQIAAALEKLDGQSYIKVIHRMRPCRLYDILEQKGLCETTLTHEGQVIVYIYESSNKEKLWFLQD